MTEPESHTLAYLRRLDETFDRLHGEVGELRSEVSERLVPRQSGLRRLARVVAS